MNNKLAQALEALRNAQYAFNVIFNTEDITLAFLTASNAKRDVRKAIWEIENGEKL